MNRKNFIKTAATGATAVALAPFRGIGKTAEGWAAQDLPGLKGWAAIRDLFPLSRDRIYFNTGGLGPPSRLVLKAMQEQALRQAVEGENFHDEFNRVRQVTAAFVGANPDEIAFTRNATEANSIIAAGLDLRAGDEVIFESHAHPGGSHPWLLRQKRNGIKVRIFEPDAGSPAANLERIFDLVNERTRVIQVSHLTAPTGILFDVGAIASEARRRGIWFHIDGAQSAGMIPFDLHAIGCHSYATSGHKWLNGPQESGFLYIAKDSNGAVAPSHAGAYSDAGFKLPDQFAFNPTAQRHEYGTRDAASILGLEAALELQEMIGRQRIAAHGKELTNLAREAIRELPGLEILTPEHPTMHNSILSFRIEGRQAHDLFSELKTVHKLRCRPVTERGLNAIRVSWHVYHQAADVKPLQSALAAICGAA